jgi:hypothetical protein
MLDYYPILYLFNRLQFPDIVLVLVVSASKSANSIVNSVKIIDTTIFRLPLSSSVDNPID